MRQPSLYDVKPSKRLLSWATANGLTSVMCWIGNSAMPTGADTLLRVRSAVKDGIRTVSLAVGWSDDFYSPPTRLATRHEIEFVMQRLGLDEADAEVTRSNVIQFEFST